MTLRSRDRLSLFARSCKQSFVQAWKTWGHCYKSSTHPGTNPTVTVTQNRTRGNFDLECLGVSLPRPGDRDRRCHGVRRPT
eukprot:2982329-Rhodomonas_salina.1